MPPYNHIPVLLKEVLEYLQPQPGQNFVDATLGGGGYSKAILEKTAPSGKLLAIDLDEDAIKNFQFPISNFQNRISLVHGNFRDIAQICVNYKFTNIQGIVADIGISSYELNQAGRGISFQKDEPLDMRFDITNNTVDARFILNSWTEQDIQKIFKDYGEEPYTYFIAKGIVRNRASEAFKTTKDLVTVIKESIPHKLSHKWQDNARRVFQALRIAVNRELESLESFLPNAFDILNPGGRLAVVTFHSLEDRMVKQFFLGLSKGCVCPPDFPQCICGRNPQGKILTKKPITASVEELTTNPRSKPAKLRVIQKT